MNAFVSDNPNNNASGSTSSATGGSASTSGTTGTTSGGGGQTDSSIVDAERVQVTLQHPTTSSVKAILDYEEKHPGTVDKKALTELKETYSRLLGNEPPERSTDPNRPEQQNQPQAEVPEAKPVVERAPSALEITQAAQEEARFRVTSAGGTVADGQNAANAVAANLSTRTNQGLADLAENPQLAAALSGIGGELRGFLSGQLNLSRGDTGTLTVVKSQGVQQENAEGVYL